MKIICPTDFSTESMKALEYAIYLSNNLDATLHILHVYNYLPHSSSVDYIKEKIREKANQDMITLLSKIKKFIVSDKAPISILVEGNPVKEILNYCTTQSIDLIVMGAQGVNSVRSIFFGSNTKMISSESTIPVLVVPTGNTHDISTKKILLALDEKELKEFNGFETLREISLRFGQLIDIIHITDKNHVDDIPFDPFISTFLSGCLNESKIIVGKDVVTSLNKYLVANKNSILVMIRRSHSLLYRLIFKTKTFSEIQNLQTPLLIIPDVP